MQYGDAQAERLHSQVNTIFMRHIGLLNRTDLMRAWSCTDVKFMSFWVFQFSM